MPCSICSRHDNMKYPLSRALWGSQGFRDKTRHKMAVVGPLLVIYSQRCMRSRLVLGRSWSLESRVLAPTIKQRGRHR